MIRFLGVMVGSAATLGSILLLLGKPEFHNERQVDTGTIVRDAIDTVAASAIEATIPAEPDELATNRPSPPNAADDEPLMPAISSSPGSTQSAMTSMRNSAQLVGPPRDSAPPVEDSTFPPGAEQNWHSFWNPFRSEIAANGFATRLTRVTGIDYRVLRLEPGSYQVAFAYADDDERRTKIAQIEQATGLELPEDSL